MLLYNKPTKTIHNVAVYFPADTIYPTYRTIYPADSTIYPAETTTYPAETAVSTVPPKYTGQADILLVIDSSVNVRKEIYLSTLQAISSLPDFFLVGLNHTLFAALIFSTGPYNMFSFTAYPTRPKWVSDIFVSSSLESS